MLNSFKTYNKNLFYPEQKNLLAVSGGVDSVVMATLFKKSGFDFAVAHCNFQLRGKESDKDEQFVKDLAESYQVPFFAKRFTTQHYAEKSHISIQMAARELRYNWLETIRQEQGYDYLATAHHKDDVIETFFINLCRGTGIAGFHGITPKQGNIIRPLLFASKQQILDYAKKNQLDYKEDKSNQSLKYVRNKIRHQIIPVLKEINPNLDESILGTIEKIEQAEYIYRDTIEQKRKEMVNVFSGKTEIFIQPLKQLHPLQAYLYEFLLPYHFNGDIVENIIESLDGISGKQFYSETHLLVKDRKKLIITPIFRKKVVEVTIEKNSIQIDEPLSLRFKTIENINYIIPKGNNYASLDKNKLIFPLQLRKWKKGDSFYPFGMNRKKKISDFLIDSKIPVNEKENIYVLTSDNKIIWVVGHRIDNRYCVNNSTKPIYCIELIHNT